MTSPYVPPGRAGRNIEQYAEAIDSQVQRAFTSIYGRTDAERARGITPVDYRYPEGHILRYGRNTSPGVTDMGPALRLAISVACYDDATTVRPCVRVPAGTYLINPESGEDSFDDGAHLPKPSDDNPIPSYGVRIRGDGPSTKLLCGADNMIMLRVSRSYVVVEDLQISGNGHSGCMGIGIVPYSMTQTTVFANQQFCTINRVHLHDLSNGVKLQPGPNVGGSDSGCFNHLINDCHFNLCSRGVWMVGTSTPSDSNRPTRSKIMNCTFTRGNVGIDLEYGTEIDIIGTNLEFYTNVYAALTPDGAGSPLATETAINIRQNSANIRIVGGYVESATKALVIHADAVPFVHAIGFHHNASPDASEATMGRMDLAWINVPQGYDSNGYLPTYLSLGGKTGGAFVLDPDNADPGVLVKDMVARVDGNEVQRWLENRDVRFTGATSFMELNGGYQLTFFRNGQNKIAATNGASATLDIETPILTLSEGLNERTDDADAAANGIPVGGLYRTGSAVKIRVT